MAVPAIELRPRGPLALFDAAIRLCAHTSGLWAVTLPGGAAVLWALYRVADAARLNEPLGVPAALLTLAWLFRGVCQAAACHYLDQALLGADEPRVGGAFRAALSRLPSVVVACAYLPAFTFVSCALTLGLGYFFFTSHLCGYAAVMQGKGHPLALYGTCSRLLGPARGNGAVLRILMWAIVLVGLNLHLGANVLVYLGRKLAGLDLTFAQRFVSLDNGEWLLTVAGLSFVAFEPLRAAVATLMRVDGRVRQEGLDLVAAVEQLPVRARRRPAHAALLAFALLLPLEGRAQAPEGPSGPPAQEPSAREAAQRAREILARPEFTQPAPAGEAGDAQAPEEGPWAWFQRWLDEWMDRLDDPQEVRERPPPGALSGAGMGAAQGVTVLLLGAAAVLIGVLLYLLFRGRGARRTPVEVVSEAAPLEGPRGESALSRPPESWAHLADELAAQGRHRDAVRSLYLALLSKLHRLGAIDYDPALSNWDYCRQLRGPGDRAQAFRDLTTRFDFAWYGRIEVGPGGYAAFRSLTASLLADDREGPIRA